MDERRRTGQKLMPVVGGIAAAATVVGGWAPASQVAAAPGDASAPDGAEDGRQLIDDGTYESCEAYFGWGKEAGSISVVEFDVADSTGDDGDAHAVPDDADVVLVLEDADGAVIECRPFQVTQDQWEAEFDELNDAAWPGPGHYAYPSLDIYPPPQPDGYEELVSVGFRVTAIPDGHTLVSPEGVQVLRSHYFFDLDLVELAVIDQRVVDLVSTEVGAEAAAAFESAAVACRDEVPHDPTDPDLIEAVTFLATYIGEDITQDPITDVNCNAVGYVMAEASYILGGHDTAAYVETILLATPEEPTTTTTAGTADTTATTTPTATGATPARPVSASPNYTG